MNENKLDLSPFCMRARNLMAKGLTEDAMGLYDDVLNIDPSNALAYADRGTAHAMSKNFTFALEDLENAINLGYKDGTTYSTLATIYFELKKYDKSLEYFSKSIEVDNKNAITYYNRSNLLYEIGDKKSAIKDLETCLHFNPDEDFKKLITERLEFIKSQ